MKIKDFRPHDVAHVALFNEQAKIMKRDNPQEYARSFAGFDDILALAQTDAYADIKKIALVVGHRFGAQGATNTDGVSEFAYWRKYLEMHISQFIDITGHEFKIFYRQNDDGNGYTERMKKLTSRINAWEADIALSFHFNAAANRNAEGFEILFSGSRQTLPCAYALLKVFDENLFGDNRGLKTRAKHEGGGGFLHRTTMPALLLEPYFGSSKADTDTFNETIDAFTNALIDFFKKI